MINIFYYRVCIHLKLIKMQHDGKCILIKEEDVHQGMQTRILKCISQNFIADVLFCVHLQVMY